MSVENDLDLQIYKKNTALKNQGYEGSYLVIGIEKYKDFIALLAFKLNRDIEIIDYYMGLKIVIVEADILEIVPRVDKAFYKFST